MQYTTNYYEIKDKKQRNLRSIVRNIALTGLSKKTQIINSGNLLEKPRIQFLYVHHVFDDEIDKFRILLKKLSAHHSFIPYSEAVEKIINNNIDKPYIVISSDDGFLNNLNAVKVMDEFGIKGCFFVNPDTIGLTQYSEIKKFCHERLNFPPVKFLDWNDVENLLRNNHEIGSHTMGHIKISETEINEVEDNLYKSYEILNQKCGSVKHFAYPYGRFFHFNKSAFNIVFEIGYRSCATAERGCHITNAPVHQEHLLLRRDHVICDWPLGHIMYFIYQNSKNALPKRNLYPNNA